VSGFVSGAYSAKLFAGIKQRFSGLSQARQCGDDVFLMFVTGYPPARGGGGIPQRIITISGSVPMQSLFDNQAAIIALFRVHEQVRR
jgi:hypothetical protein